jgi:catechol 2,3-dioxygenase-like lactoylglutathione lyase family enzyme
MLDTIGSGEGEPMAVLAYATVGSNRMDEAKAFYDALLGQAGFSPLFDPPSGGRLYGSGATAFGVLHPQNGQAATAGNGAMLGFRCDTRGEVDALYAKALELGGTDEGPPGPRGPEFYMAYFRDREGNKLCAFCNG